MMLRGRDSYLVQKLLGCVPRMENNRFSYAAGCQRSLRNYPGDHAKKANLFASSSLSLSWRLCAFLRCWSGYVLDHAHHRRNESHSRSLKPGVVHHIHVYTNCAGESRGGVKLLRTCSAHIEQSTLKINATSNCGSHVEENSSKRSLASCVERANTKYTAWEGHG